MPPPVASLTIASIETLLKEPEDPDELLRNDDVSIDVPNGPAEVAVARYDDDPPLDNCPGDG